MFPSRTEVPATGTGGTSTPIDVLALFDLLIAHEYDDKGNKLANGPQLTFTLTGGLALVKGSFA